MPDVRCRVRTHAAGQRGLEAFLAACNARGWINARGTQRTDSPHVLAAIRTLHRLAWVLEARHDARHQRRAAEPAWVQPHVPLDGYPRYGRRSDHARLPNDPSTRAALARQVGADGYPLLAWAQTADISRGRSNLPALEARRPIGRQHDDRCPVPGLEAFRWRTGDEPPPAAVRLASPSDLEARYSSTRETPWVGEKGHRPETCAADHPDLLTPVMTTPATTPDRLMGPPFNTT